MHVMNNTYTWLIIQLVKTGYLKNVLKLASSRPTIKCLNATGERKPVSSSGSRNSRRNRKTGEGRRLYFLADIDEIEDYSRTLYETSRKWHRDGTSLWCQETVSTRQRHAPAVADRVSRDGTVLQSVMSVRPPVRQTVSTLSFEPTDLPP